MLGGPKRQSLAITTALSTNDPNHPRCQTHSSAVHELAHDRVPAHAAVIFLGLVVTRPHRQDALDRHPGVQKLSLRLFQSKRTRNEHRRGTSSARSLVMLSGSHSLKGTRCAPEDSRKAQQTQHKRPRVNIFLGSEEAPRRIPAPESAARYGSREVDVNTSSIHTGTSHHAGNDFN